MWERPQQAGWELRVYGSVLHNKSRKAQIRRPKVCRTARLPGTQKTMLYAFVEAVKEFKVITHKTNSSWYEGSCRNLIMNNVPSTRCWQATILLTSPFLRRGFQGLLCGYEDFRHDSFAVFMYLFHVVFEAPNLISKAKTTPNV